MKKVILRIEGMTCSACSSGLEKYLNKQNGINEATVNLILGIATITYNEISQKDIERYISEAGFKSLGKFKDFSDEEENKKEKSKFYIFGLLLFIIMYISMAHMFNWKEIPYFEFKENTLNFGIISIIFCILFFGFGKDIFKSGTSALIHKMPNMDTLVALGTITNFGFSVYSFINILLGKTEYMSSLYFESSVMTIYFVKLGRYIETLNKDKTKSAIRSLVQITPKQENVIKNNEEIVVSIDEIQTEDIVVCKPGEKIAVDGIIINGKSHLDESFITGESKPVAKTIGDIVVAGAINYDGIIYYKAEKIGKDTTISEIVKMVVESTSVKNNIQRIADKVSGIFVPIIFVIAIITAIVYLLLSNPLSLSIQRFVTVLLVACPCALGLSVPIVVALANGIYAKKGIYIKKSESLECAKSIDTIVLDKTGIITYGKLKIEKVCNYSNMKDEELLNIISSLENKTSHPISSAFKEFEANKRVENFENLVGIGIKGDIEGNTYYIGNEKIISLIKIQNNYIGEFEKLTKLKNTVSYVIKDKEIIAIVALKDSIRENVKEFIKEAANNNIEIIMLTGDNENVAKMIASEINVKKVFSNVTPKEKEKKINELLESGKKVIMIGDGINDAPALSKATIGISIKDATDIAVDSSDVIILNNNLKNVLDFIDISKNAYKIIKQNLFWAFFYNLIMVLIATGSLVKLGINMKPTVASIAMTVSSLTVVLNSFRILKKGEKK